MFLLNREPSLIATLCGIPELYSDQMTHICVSKPSHVRLFGAKPFQPMLVCFQEDHDWHISMKFIWKSKVVRPLYTYESVCKMAAIISRLKMFKDEHCDF